MSNWKNFEREVAKYYGGKRRIRVSYSESVGDIIHPIYSIECKFRKHMPAKALGGKRCKFLDSAFHQAFSYNPTLIPMVCLKRKYMNGFVSIVGYPLATKVTRVRVC